jgi:hypothetical protein
MDSQSMLPAPSPHAHNALAPVPTRFRAPESRPPRALLMLSYTNHILQPTPCRAHIAHRARAWCHPTGAAVASAIPMTPRPANFAPGCPTLASGCQDCGSVWGPRVGKSQALVGRRGCWEGRWQVARNTAQEAQGDVAGLRHLPPRARHQEQEVWPRAALWLSWSTSIRFSTLAATWCVQSPIFLSNVRG